MWPIIAKIGPITIHSYGLALMVGFFLSVWVGMHLAHRYGLKPDQIGDAAIWALIPGVIGARLLFVLLNLSHYPSLASSLRIWEGGLSLHGGLLGGLLGLLTYAQKRRINPRILLDLSALSLGIGYVFGKIGCFLNGCCYGHPTYLPWGIRFPLVEDPSKLTPPSHPTQLYAVLAGVLLWGFLLRFSRKKHPKGLIALLWVLLYSTWRFGEEALRKGATAQELAWGLTYGQFASLLLVILCLSLGFWLLHQEKKASVNLDSAHLPGRS